MFKRKRKDDTMNCPNYDEETSTAMPGIVFCKCGRRWTVKKSETEPTPPQCCQRQGVSLWLCPHCNTISEVQPTFVDGHFSCCECCFGEMTVRFEAPEPTGTALLDELKPGTVQSINGVVCLVGMDEDNEKSVTPSTNTNLYTWYSEEHCEWRDCFELSEGINMLVSDLTRAHIKQVYPEAK